MTIRLQATEHELVPTSHFRSIEDYCLFLIHRKAYEEAAKVARDAVVLDVGCNIGYGTAIIGVSCKQIFGVDVSARAINEANRRFKSDSIEFRLYDGCRLPFSNREFDLITGFQVIEHVEDCHSFLSELKRVSKPGGKLLLTTPNAQIRLEPNMKPWNVFHEREFSADELKKLLFAYFDSVLLEGLFAEERFYSVEIERIAREKAEHLRARSDSLTTRIKTLVPPSLRTAVKGVIRTIKGGRQPAPLGHESLQQFSTSSLYYSKKDLSRALDLRATCITSGVAGASAISTESLM